MEYKEFCMDCERRLYRAHWSDAFSGNKADVIVEYKDGVRCGECAKKKK